jgi:hypothetical protein
MEYELKPMSIRPASPTQSTTYPVITRFYVNVWQGVFRVLQFLHDRRLDFVMTPVSDRQGWQFEIATYDYDYEELTKDLERVAHASR